MNSNIINVVVFTQALYAAAFSMSDICHPFSIYTQVDHVAVDPFGSSLAALVKVSSVFVVEENENAPEILHLFSEVSAYSQ